LSWIEKECNADQRRDRWRGAEEKRRKKKFVRKRDLHKVQGGSGGKIKLGPQSISEKKKKGKEPPLVKGANPTPAIEKTV